MLMVKKYYLPLKKGKKSHYLSVEWQRLTATFHLTLMMTSAQVVETSVTTTDNSPSQGYNHPDDQTTLLHVTPGFKPFTVQHYYSVKTEV